MRPTAVRSSRVRSTTASPSSTRPTCTPRARASACSGAPSRNCAADRHGWTRFVTMQNHYNLIYREEEREMLPFCHDQGIGVIPWSPLARGFLAGNRRRADRGETVRAKTDEFAHEMYYDDSDFAVADRAAQIAGRRGVQPAQIALAWLLSKPGVAAPIVGASKPPHLEEAVGALGIRLDEEEMRFLEDCYRPHRILGH